MSDPGAAPVLGRKLARAIQDFRDVVTKDGGSATITFGEQSVTIGGPVPTAQGEVAADHDGPTPEDRPELPLTPPKGKSRNRPGGMNVGRLKSFVERTEKLEEERKAIGSDIGDVYSELKGVGYDVRTVRKLIALRKLDAADRDEQEALLDVYKHALGMI